MNKSVTQVRDALIDTLKKLKLSNDFQSELPDDHIHKAYSASLVSSNRDDAYPKCFVMIDNGRVENQVGSQQQKRLDFTVLIVVKSTPASGNLDPQVMVQRFVEDMEKLMADNDDLNGTVQDAQLTEWYIDGGVAAPEGVAAFQISTIRFNR